METDKSLSKRKPTRLKNFDYSTSGAYFVTICLSERKQLLSEIKKNTEFTDKPIADSDERFSVFLKPCGEIVNEQLLSINDRYPNVCVSDFVIMPDHIHAIIIIKNTSEKNVVVSLNDIVCSFKSLTSRFCKEKFGIEKIFERSYADHIIRNKDDYEIRKKYIYENPKRWYYKHLN